MGQSVGDSEAGLTVLLLDCAVMRMPSMREEVAVVCDAIWPSWELNSSCENVMGFGLRASNEGEEPDEPNFWRSSSIMWWALSSLSTSSWFFFSRASTSWRLRSRDDCAARRLRRTRSTLRCSFSSSVLARFLEGRSAVVRRTRYDHVSYLGGRLVLGSGRTWPHDFLFFVCFFSPVPGSGVEDAASRSPPEREELSLWSSS